MLRTIAISGAVVVGIVGVGVTALASTGSASPSSSGSSSSTASTSATGSKTVKHPRAARALLRKGLHGQVVTKNGKGGFTTHDEVRGTVSAVSSTGITVKAADGFSQTYAVTSSTKVRMRTAGKGAASTIGAVQVGDAVGVLGTADGSAATATLVVDVKR